MEHNMESKREVSPQDRLNEVREGKNKLQNLIRALSETEGN